MIIVFLLFVMTLKTSAAYTIQNLTFYNHIDHFTASSLGKFPQRYYVVDDFWPKKNGSLVVLHLCGESRCDFPMNRLFPLLVAEQLKGKYIALEHRYYGESQPFKDWSLPNLKYLNHEQALADIAYFIEYTKGEIREKHGIETKWIVVGGSYAGGLAAWFRYKYPHIAVGALASSGVVTPLNDYWQFEKQVVDDILESGEFCFNILQYYEAVTEEKLFRSSQAEREAFIKLFGGDGTETAEEFMYYFADLHSLFPQYSHREQLCNLLKALNQSNIPLEEQLKQYAFWGLKNGTDLHKYTYNWRRNETINTHISSRQWAYQFCTSYGWLQTPSREKPLRWKGMDLSFWFRYCREIFGTVVIPKLNHTDAMFGGTTVAKYATNVFFTQGRDDPWRWVGVNGLPAEATKNELGIMNCDDCGHCRELYTPTHTDPKEVKEVRERIIKAFKKWISE